MKVEFAHFQWMKLNEPIRLCRHSESPTLRDLNEF